MQMKLCVRDGGIELWLLRAVLTLGFGEILDVLMSPVNFGLGVVDGFVSCKGLVPLL